MPLVKNVEKKIWDIEGFDVTIKHPNGGDVRGDKAGIPQYDFERKMKNDCTVNDWKQNRFLKSYPGFDVDVLDATGLPTTGQKKLSTVRDTYIED